VVIWTLLFSCSGTSPLIDPELSPRRVLTRLSLDLRGVRPSPQELALVDADASAVESLADEFLLDERFEERVRDLFAEVLLTRVDDLPISAADYGQSDEAAFLASVGEETLRIISHVAANDLPWTEVVTADWTMANEVLGDAWPLDYPQSASGWQKVRYTDGRPAAGVLATNSLWWRYPSTASNANRKRANAVSRMFLCHDYLTRPIEFSRDVDLLDDDAVLDAIQTNPGCVACHATIEPLAGYFFGFYYYDNTNPDDASIYHPERELLYRDFTGVEPGYFGEPGSSLWDLGQQLAGDNRFLECAVENVYEGLLRRDVLLEDADALTAHREAFIQGDLTLRALFRSVVSDPRYRYAVDGEAVGGTATVPLKMVTSELLASQVQDLTGFHWTYGGYDMLGTDNPGLRTLAGGIDGYGGSASARGPNATILLVQERLAEAAAVFVAEHDNTAGTEPTLFTQIDFTETPETGRDAMAEQLVDLHERVFGTQILADGEEVDANLVLWEQLYQVERDQQAAWAGLLSALLRDPDFLFY
jgi:hypothetical protein